MTFFSSGKAIPKKLVSLISLSIMGIALIFPMLTLYIITQNDFNIPLWDDWYSPILTAFASEEGRISLHELIRVDHHIHRYFFNQLTTLFFTEFTQWNVGLQTYVGFILAIGKLAIIQFILWKQGKHYALIALLPMTMLIFSVHQGTNWIVRAHVGFHFVTFFVLLVAAVLYSEKRESYRILLATIVAVIGTFNGATGLIIWGAMFVAMPIMGYRHRVYLGLWLITGLIIGLVYIYGIDVNSGLGEKSTPTNPVLLLEFLVLYLGRIFSANQFIATLIGTIGLILAGVNIIYLWYTPISRIVIGLWSGIMLYALGTGLLVAIGRLERVGLSRAMRDFYVTYSLLFWCAWIVLAICVIEHIIKNFPSSVWLRSTLFVVNVLLMLVMVFGYNYYLIRREIPAINSLHRQWAAGYVCMQQFIESRDDSCLNHVGWHPEIIDRLDKLHQYQLVLYADPVSTE